MAMVSYPEDPWAESKWGIFGVEGLIKSKIYVEEKLLSVLVEI